MLTNKQIAYLKGLANKEKSVLQIGKDGLNDTLRQNVRNYLNKHELIKINELDTNPNSDEEVIEFFTKAGIEFVEHKGKTYVFYMHSEDAKNPIVLPKKTK